MTARSRPLLLDSRPGTFSMTTQDGSNSSIILANSNQSPDRSPASPRRFPAMERSWQGNPPQIRSTVFDSCVFAPIFLTSVCSSECGKCRRKTFCAFLSISHTATLCIPAFSKARSNPPMPENRDMNFITTPSARRTLSRCSSPTWSHSQAESWRGSCSRSRSPCHRSGWRRTSTRIERMNR